MKKVLALVALVAVVAAAYFFFSHKPAELSAEDAAEAKHAEWRRTAVEPENQRPAEMQAIKYQPNSKSLEEAAPDVRMPASSEEK